MPDISTKPYMLRAIYEWCTDSGFTPYLAVKVDAATTVPMEYVKKGEIVLNISFGATSGLKMDNDAVHFHARFGGVSREIYVPVQQRAGDLRQRERPGHGVRGRPRRRRERRRAGRQRRQRRRRRCPRCLPQRPRSLPPALSQIPDDDNEPPKKGGRPTLTVIK